MLNTTAQSNLYRVDLGQGCRYWILHRSTDGSVNHVGRDWERIGTPYGFGPFDNQAEAMRAAEKCCQKMDKEKSESCTAK